MVYSFAEAMLRYGEQARAAAARRTDDAPVVRYLCRSCDHQWMSSDPICLFCGRVTLQQELFARVSLFDPIHVETPNNLGIPPTHFEATGI